MAKFVIYKLFPLIIAKLPDSDLDSFCIKSQSYSSILSLSYIVIPPILLNKYKHTMICMSFSLHHFRGNSFFPF